MEEVKALVPLEYFTPVEAAHAARIVADIGT
jgi:hypothetical protein